MPGARPSTLPGSLDVVGEPPSLEGCTSANSSRSPTARTAYMVARVVKPKSLFRTAPIGNAGQAMPDPDDS
jgi:hypothetical protein